MQDQDPEFKPVESVVKPDLELIQDTPDIIFKCTGCGQEVIVNSPPSETGDPEADFEVAYGTARAEHTCLARPHPDLDDAPPDLPLEPEPFEHKEVGQPIRYILTTAEADMVIIDPNIVGLSPFFHSAEAGRACGLPYRARVWRLEEV